MIDLTQPPPPDPLLNPLFADVFCVLTLRHVIGIY